MTFTELKAKHGERVITSLATEIVVQGMRAIGSQEPKSSHGLLLLAALHDLTEADWNDVRATIKRSL